MREITEACSRSTSAWIERAGGRRLRRLRRAAPRVVELKRRQAEAIGIGDEPYDALLDSFEPGARAAQLEPVFADLRERLALIVAAASAREPAELPPRDWPEEGQMAFAHDMAGLVFRGDRPARSPARPTLHLLAPRRRRALHDPLDRSSPLSSIGAVMHELGHALYEQGLPADDCTPLHDAPSLGPRVAVALLGEPGRAHARSWGTPSRTCGAASEAMTGLDPALMHRAATRVVRPSLIRVEADEVTYNLHIVPRFEPSSR